MFHVIMKVKNKYKICIAIRKEFTKNNNKLFINTTLTGAPYS